MLCSHSLRTDAGSVVERLSAPLATHVIPRIAVCTDPPTLRKNPVGHLRSEWPPQLSKSQPRISIPFRSLASQCEADGFGLFHLVRPEGVRSVPKYACRWPRQRGTARPIDVNGGHNRSIVVSVRCLAPDVQTVPDVFERGLISLPNLA